MNKISIIGAGGVGSQTAYMLASKNLGEIVLMDIVDGLPQGKALDIFEALPLTGVSNSIIGSTKYEDTKNSSIVIITSGVARKAGVSRRSHLLSLNADIIKSVTETVIRYSPGAILLVVTNPVDAMTYLTFTLSGFPKHRVIGMAGVLDSARFRAFTAQELGVAVSAIDAMVLGSHGDLMVPIASLCTVNKTPISELLPKERIDYIISKVRNAGGEIVELLKNGSTVYAPALAITTMIEAILHDQKSVLPCSVVLEREYGIKNVCAGVPATLGKNGVESIIEVPLTPQEKQAFTHSCEHVRSMIRSLPL